MQSDPLGEDIRVDILGTGQFSTFRWALHPVSKNRSEQVLGMSAGTGGTLGARGWLPALPEI